MNHIRIRIRSSRQDEATGRLTYARIGGLLHELDFECYDLPLILHALSAPGWQEQASGDFILDTSTLDSEQWLLG